MQLWSNGSTRTGSRGRRAPERNLFIPSTSLQEADALQDCSFIALVSSKSA